MLAPILCKNSAKIDVKSWKNKKKNEKKLIKKMEKQF